MVAKNAKKLCTERLKPEIMIAMNSVINHIDKHYKHADDNETERDEDNETRMKHGRDGRERRGRRHGRQKHRAN